MHFKNMPILQPLNFLQSQGNGELAPDIDQRSSVYEGVTYAGIPSRHSVIYSTHQIYAVNNIINNLEHEDTIRQITPSRHRNQSKYR